MKHMIIVAGLALVAIFGAWYYLGPGSDMSGTYVGKNASQAYLVQIVQGQGGQLSGFYEESGLSADGAAVNQDNVPLTGQRDGKTFEITLVPGGLAHFFVGSISLSGLYSGTSITLNGQSNGLWANLNLVKGSAADYSNYVAGLNAQAQLTENMRLQQEQAREQQAAQQAAAQQEADAAQDLENRITNDLAINSTTSTTVAARVQQLNLDVTKIRSVTTKMRDYLEKEAAIGGYQSVTGAQISVAMNQANAELTSDMIGLQSRFSDIQQNGIPALLDHFKQHDVTCEGLNATSSTQASFTGPQAELSDCIELEEATPALQQEVSQLDAAYQAVFSTWQVENAKQQAIIQQSEH